ncbi:hypothetical protein [Mycolicibacterium elephantis]|nr:hypothetical protein [Mycolicibacterium elephantis]MCV7219612.1 hypothetical protein [Mycolicibacterium elephantis]
MQHRTRSLVLALAAACMHLTTAPAAANADECSAILPVADRLQPELNQVFPSGTAPYVAGRIRSALSPLYGLTSAAAVDLRIRSDMLAAQIDDSDPYRPARPDLLAGDLAKANELLAAARRYCAH